MADFFDGLGVSQFLTSARLLGIVRAAVVLAVGLFIAHAVSRSVVRVFRGRLDAHGTKLLKRFTYYSILVIVVATTLHQLGFNLGALLGAIGILTVAIGFAAQTSASNLISGLFLIVERPFVVGDLLNIDGTVGEVVSIDLLSVKIRTFDNLMLRVPNETLVKSSFLNLTRFPIRRFDVQLSVAYKEDTEKVRRILVDVADRNPICLDEPRPLFIYRGYGDSGLELQFSVWAKRQNFLLLRNSIQEEIKKAFDENGIEIPFPHRSLYTGSVTEPFPIRVVEGA
jgi:small-conductance mechanosensitive channel